MGGADEEGRTTYLEKVLHLRLARDGLDEHALARLAARRRELDRLVAIRHRVSPLHELHVDHRAIRVVHWVGGVPLHGVGVPGGGGGESVRGGRSVSGSGESERRAAGRARWEGGTETRENTEGKTEQPAALRKTEVFSLISII